MFHSRHSCGLRVSLCSVRCCVLGLALLGAGCASKYADEAGPARVNGPSSPSGIARVEVEAEVPVQPSPVLKPGLDDPSEPFSPNYGSAPPKIEPPPQQPEREPPRPATQKPKFAGQQRLLQISIFDEDALIRRAIAEHEMRRQD